MNKLQQLEKLVRQQYAAKNPNRADWADWLSQNHVFVVADNARQLAERFGGNTELAQAAGMLHDIADSQMSRFNKEHEQTSFAIARDLLQQCGFTADEIATVVDDAIKYHSCNDGQVPQTLEGKMLATADSQAHLNTDFYVFGVWAVASDKQLADIKAWTLKKIDRDFHDKILFPEVKAECEANYLALKNVFSR